MLKLGKKEDKLIYELVHLPTEGGLSSPAAYFPMTPPHL